MGCVSFSFAVELPAVATTFSLPFLASVFFAFLASGTVTVADPPAATSYLAVPTGLPLTESVSVPVQAPPPDGQLAGTGTWPLLGTLIFAFFSCSAPPGPPETSTESVAESLEASRSSWVARVAVTEAEPPMMGFTCRSTEELEPGAIAPGWSQTASLPDWVQVHPEPLALT